MHTAGSGGPLKGLRILDMTSVLMGPTATQLLGDMGADVIKVEPPDGDLVRQVGPARNPGMGALYLNANRSKRSICIDLKTAEGRDLLLRLARDADALVYNVRPRAMARLGLDYEAVSAANPRIVYAGLFGFDQAGPYAAKPAYDDLIQGASGLAALIARAGDGVPRYVPSAVADRVVGLMAVGVICATLLERERSGLGQRVDIPMFETMTAFVLGDHLGGLSFEPPLDGGGYARHLTPERRPYATRDGYICALLYNDAHWQRFLLRVGEAALAEDPRFATLASRLQNIDHVYGALRRIFLERTTRDWLELLDELDIPAAPYNDLPGILDDPQLGASDFFQRAVHPSEGPIRTMRLPARWSRTAPAVDRLAPRLGEHGIEVLHEAGLAEKDIARLLDAGAVRVDAPQR